jgi:membrane dipeptidase
VLFAHIDKIAAITGDYRHVAIGTDLDGFIKPVLTGLDAMADLAKLEQALEAKYGEDAKLIASDNALRVLRQLWS